MEQTGSLTGVTRHDYLPFGEELFAGTGGPHRGNGLRRGWRKVVCVLTPTSLVRPVEAHNELGFQLANTWPKITAHDVYAMVRNGKKRQNP